VGQIAVLGLKSLVESLVVDLLEGVKSQVVRLRDWIYGGKDFLKCMLALSEGKDENRNRRWKQLIPTAYQT